VIAGLATEEVERLRRYGNSLGMAFQIADDVLDYVATSAEVGKPVGADLRQGTVTLPLMLARDDPDAGPRLREILDKRDLNDADYEEVVTLVRNSTAIADAERSAQTFAQQAALELRGFPASEALTTLERVCDYVVERRI
jgi:geranylgeranyl pyrophosphate synthase